MPIGVKIFGKKFAQLRRAHRLNQSTIAARAEMSLENVKRLEKGEVVATDRENIPLLAGALGIPVEDFEAAVLADRPATVTLELPRVVHDALEAKAKRLGVTLDQWFARQARFKGKVTTQTPPSVASKPSAGPQRGRPGRRPAAAAPQQT